MLHDLSSAPVLELTGEAQPPNEDQIAPVSTRYRRSRGAFNPEFRASTAAGEIRYCSEDHTKLCAPARCETRSATH